MNFVKPVFYISVSIKSWWCGAGPKRVFTMMCAAQYKDSDSEIRAMHQPCAHMQWEKCAGAVGMSAISGRKSEWIGVVPLGGRGGLGPGHNSRALLPLSLLHSINAARLFRLRECLYQHWANEGLDGAESHPLEIKSRDAGHLFPYKSPDTFLSKVE